jgi:adenylate kinase
MAYRTILLFGAPGSGKGTQGRILAAIPGLFHCACGDVFRSLDLQSEVGRAFWSYSSRGMLVPDEFTVALWQQTIRGMEFTNRFRPASEVLVLDGLPRNINQARMLADTLDIMRIVHLACDDLGKMAERLGRRALKENRPDDAREDVIRRRLGIYEAQTRPVLECYPAERVVKIDAARSQIAVLTDVLASVRTVLDPQSAPGPLSEPEMSVV